MTNYKKVASGQDLIIDSGVWNAVQDAGKYVESLRDSKGRLPKADGLPDGIYNVKNNSGVNLPRYSVLGIDDPLFDPVVFFQAFSQEVALTCSTPTAGQHECKYVILQEPLLNGEVGRAWACDLAPAKIEPDSSGTGTGTGTGGSAPQLPALAQMIDSDTSRLQATTTGYPIVWLSDVADADANGPFYWAIINLTPSDGCATPDSSESTTTDCCAPPRCYPTGTHLITTCGSMACLYDKYKVLGTLPFSGNVILNHISACVYESAAFDVKICDVYYCDSYWRLTVDGSDPHGSKLELISTGNTSAAGTNSGTGTGTGCAAVPLLYKTYKSPFNPLAGNSFALWFNCSVPATIAHTFPCEVCVVAVGDVCEPCPPPPFISTPCCPDPIPATLTVTLLDGSGTCPNTATGTLTYSPIFIGPGFYSWTGSITLCGTTIDLLWQCTNISDGFQLTTTINGITIKSGADAPSTCTPFHIEHTMKNTTTGPNITCGGCLLGDPLLFVVSA